MVSAFFLTAMRVSRSIRIEISNFQNAKLTASSLCAICVICLQFDLLPPDVSWVENIVVEHLRMHPEARTQRFDGRCQPLACAYGNAGASASDRGNNCRTTIDSGVWIGMLHRCDR